MSFLWVVFSFELEAEGFFNAFFAGSTGGARSSKSSGERGEH